MTPRGVFFFLMLKSEMLASFLHLTNREKTFMLEVQ